MWGEAIEALRRDLVTVGKRLFDFGMAFGTSGNISAVVPGTQMALLKRTGVCLGDARPDDYLLVDFEGNVLEGEGRPSKEHRFHTGIYRARPDVGAVVHVHPPYATAFSVVADVLPIITAAGKANLGRVPTIPAYPAGSAELAQAVVNQLLDPSVKAVLMEAHGVTAVGPDIVKASYAACLLEESARVAYLVENMKARAPRGS